MVCIAQFVTHILWFKLGYILVNLYWNMQNRLNEPYIINVNVNIGIKAFMFQDFVGIRFYFSAHFFKFRNRCHVLRRPTFKKMYSMFKPFIRIIKYCHTF